MRTAAIDMILAFSFSLIDMSRSFRFLIIVGLADFKDSNLQKYR